MSAAIVAAVSTGLILRCRHVRRLHQDRVIVNFVWAAD